MARRSASYKRLIVLCDGTWQNSLSPGAGSYPTNVARFSRAIAPYAQITEKGPDGTEVVKEVEQIVYYQPGVGTGAGDQLRGGAYGLGISANIRAAYGFLAHNWDPDPGDEIFFFGFSRGAYTARCIAGLVASLGLLTKRGMDHFPDVYEEYYKTKRKAGEEFIFTDALWNKIKGEVSKAAKDAIKVVGVWDTVAFHGEDMRGEEEESGNAVLSPRIQYAYHALSLDERRNAYSPSLWKWPKGHVAGSRTDGKGLQVMKQVWFSGQHSDVGGGRFDPRMSNISLGWMLAQCAKDDKLAFLDEVGDAYLLEQGAATTTPGKWGTSLGPGAQGAGKGLLWSAIGAVEGLVLSSDRRPLQENDTNEKIHRSIVDRPLKTWPCGPLKGTHDGTKWPLKRPGDQGDSLIESEVDEVSDKIEAKYQGRIRSTPGERSYP